MQRHKIVRKASVGVLLFLPLVAVGIALALMLSLGHQNPQQASADATSEIEFSMSAPGCDTNNVPEADICTQNVGSSFTVELSWNGFSGAHGPDAPNVQMVVVWGGPLNGPNPANTKKLNNENPNGCDIPIATLKPGGNPKSFALACGVLFSSTIDTGLFGTAEFNCKGAGVGTIVLLHSNATSLATDAALQPHWEDNAADTLNVDCLPPDGEININKVAKDNGQLLGGSCWLIFAVVPLSPPPNATTLNKPLDIVSDNQSEPTLCDDVGPLNANPLADLSDRNPTVGLIDINIPGALQVKLDTNVFHFQEVKAPDKYVINDSTKYPCTFTDTPKVADPGEAPGKVGCDEDGGTSTTIQNERVKGNLTVSFKDGDGNNIIGKNFCVEIKDKSGQKANKQLCDQDDGNKDGKASQALQRGTYNINFKLGSKDNSVWIVRAPASFEADLENNKTAAGEFVFDPAKPIFQKDKPLANLFLTAQGVKLDPNNCEESTDVAIFTQSLSNPPSSLNEKGDPQDVRAFEYEIRFDGSQVCVSWTPGKFVTNNNMTCAKTFSEEKGLIEVGCVTQKTSPQAPVDNSNLQLGVIEVRPQPSLYSIINPTQDNGVVVQIRNDQCNLADLEGHKINAAPIGVGTKCPDSDLTIRWLEGDVNGDCVVDTADQQLLAFRWGISKGVTLYNARYNLVGSNDVINIKDVQFVFGRHNSSCDQFNSAGQTGPTNPPQPPVNKKATP